VWERATGKPIHPAIVWQDRRTASRCSAVSYTHLDVYKRQHYYKSDGEKNFAPSTELSLPAALAPVVEAVRNLNDFRPKAMHITGNAARTRPAFSSSQSSSVFFAPQDIWVVYDFPKPVSGYIGTGQKIAIMGQSAILASDITNFQNAAELTPKAPTLVLVPSTGTSTVVTNDESESDLDLEWSSACLLYTSGSGSFGAGEPGGLSGPLHSHVSESGHRPPAGPGTVQMARFRPPPKMAQPLVQLCDEIGVYT